jgi:uncharacterized protein (TIGR02271 family)
MSDKTIVALYDTETEAETAVTALEQAGVSRGDVSIVTRQRGTATGLSDDEVDRMGDHGAGSGLTDSSTHGSRSLSDRMGMGDDEDRASVGRGLHALPGIGRARITGPLISQFGGTGRGVNGGLVPALQGLGVPYDDAEGYAEGVRRGGSLIVARVADTRVDDAIHALERHVPVDLESRRGEWRTGGWTGFDQSSDTDYPLETTGIGDAATRLRDTDRESIATTGASPPTDVETGREETVPLVEEELEIGKRQVERGAVRVRSYVVETPVSEDVRLRDETVTVERREASDASLAAGAEAFRERTVEVRETDEVPVVRKSAHVTGEVVVRKDVEERVETVSDTVRRTEVEVEDARSTATTPKDRTTTPPRR